MKLVLKTAPTEQPVLLEECKAYSRITWDDEDALLAEILNAAVDQAEEYTGRRFVTQTWDLFVDAWPLAADRYEIELPYPPLVSVGAVTYTDTDGDSQTLATSVYEVISGVEQIPGKIRLKYDQSWPGKRSHQDTIDITFTCGYGDRADVPEQVRLAIKKLFDNHYKRSPSEADVELAWRLLDFYRIRLPAA